MSWLIFAVIGHLANGAAFAIDKMLLKSAFSRSATYAGLVGVLSTIVVLAVPFVVSWPQGGGWFLAVVSGAAFIFALWAFFAAMARAEASRVVPIVGSLIPVFTLAGSFAFLAERLSDRTFVGFGLLIIATFMLSGGKTAGRPNSQTVWLAVTAAILFAVSSVTGKAVYDASGFFGGFVVSRLAAALTALGLLALIDPKAGQEAWNIIQPAKEGRSKSKQPGNLAGILALVGQGLGAIGFVLIQYAMSKGSASLVNALQAVQYAFLVMLALALRKRALQLLGEHLDKRTLLLKGTALGITAVGMYLLV
jgi:drug/metabolite transporter (DMT)-like permease